MLGSKDITRPEALLNIGMEHLGLRLEYLVQLVEQ
jgi:hypothetical protein